MKASVGNSLIIQSKMLKKKLKIMKMIQIINVMIKVRIKRRRKLRM